MSLLICIIIGSKTVKRNIRLNWELADIKTLQRGDKMPKEMRYVIIKFGGKPIGRAEKVYFPKVRKSAKSVDCHGDVIFEEDD